MTPSAARTALSTALLTTSIKSVAKWRVGKVPDLLPAAIISIDTATPDTFGDGTHASRVSVEVLVSQAEEPSAWDKIDTLLASNAIGTAVNAATVEMTVVGYTSIGQVIPYAGVDYLGFVIDIEVLD